MNDDSWVPRDSNDNAFTVQETRQGVPLDYVAEKLQHAIEGLALAIGQFNAYFPDGISFPPPYPPDYPTVKIALGNDLRRIFEKQVVAYVALCNMLAVANDHVLFDRLLGYTPEELTEWLNRIWSSGQLSDRHIGGQ